MNLIIHGPPAIGKSFVAHHIETNLGIRHINLGDILREYAENGWINAKDPLKQGRLLEDDLVNKVVITEVRKHDSFILDGYPKRQSQAEYIYRAGIPIDKVLILTTDKSTDELITLVKSRLICECGMSYNEIVLPPIVEGICDECYSKLIIRDDQNERAIIKRIDSYFKQIDGIIKFYQQNGYDLLFYNADSNLRICSNVIINDLKEILGK